MSATPPVLDIPPQPVPAWPALRSELLQLIEGTSRGSWTDYNVHDPGVTLGEHFAFGVHEAGYVASLPIGDLLTPVEEAPAPPSPDFPAALVLPCRPLTLPDYRRLLIDLEGIRNAWIATVESPDPRVYADCDTGGLTLTPGDNTQEVSLRGFYHVQVELEEDDPASPTADTLLQLAREILAANRNLCEVFLSVEPVEVDLVGICTELVAAEDADLVELAAQIFLALETFIAPPIPFRTLEELVARGLSPEDIFEGPLLRHGFIDDADLEAAERKSELRASDLIQVLLDIPGVLAVRKLLMTRYREAPDGQLQPTSTGEPWILPLDANRATRLSLAHSRLLFFKGSLPFLLNQDEVGARLDELRAAGRLEKQAPRLATLPAPPRRHRALDEYPTLLNLLPLNYGVGQAGLPRDATPARQAQARQLKAYFLLGELLLSGQRAQVAHLPDIFSLWRSVSVLSATAPARLRDFEALAGGLTAAAFAAALQPQVEPEADRLRRRLALFDHWLARVAEPFDPYVLVSTSRIRQPDAERLLADKARLLAALPELAHDRAAATNLCVAAAAGNLSGLESRLHVLLGTSLDLGTALQFQQDAAPDGEPSWRFTILDAGGDVVLVSSRALLTREGAEAEASLAGRVGAVLQRYRPTPAPVGGFTFSLTDATGEAIAAPPAAFPSEAARDAAVAACVALFQALAPDLELYLLEHILLRPRENSTRFLPLCDPEPGPGGACSTDDPYSFRATLILPSWPSRFGNLYFREHFERIAREQVPAHVFLKICWLTQEQMALFRAAWTTWRSDLAAECAGQPNTLPQSQDALIDVWLQLRSQFPVATLHDCVDGDDENPVVLDKTVLGTLQEEDPS